MGFLHSKPRNQTAASEEEKDTEDNKDTDDYGTEEDETELASDFLHEIIIEEPILVPISLPEYRKPCPPPNKKEDVFNKEDYIAVDNKARKVSDEKTFNYQELIDSLMSGLETDLQKLRAIFIWLGHQDIENGDYSEVTSSDTPKGYMKLMKEKKGTYASFFALLCRAAGLQCVIIKGKGKSICYQVGMTVEECQSLHNTWNAVFVGGCWRLVFPLWAYRAIVGYAEGYFVKVEEKDFSQPDYSNVHRFDVLGCGWDGQRVSVLDSESNLYEGTHKSHTFKVAIENNVSAKFKSKTLGMLGDMIQILKAQNIARAKIFKKIYIHSGKATRKKKRPSSGKSVTHLNEFYFLTNPEELIFMCFPDEKEWQLLKSPWTLKNFLEVPYCQQSFFEEKVVITSEHTCRLHTVDGECTVSVRGNDKKTSFNYKLYYNEKESKDPISDNPQLHRYVCMSYEESEIQFKVRFPQPGVYKLQIVGGKTYSNLELCSFKIFCTEPKENCQPLPINPLIGFGPTYEMEKAGIKAVSHRGGIVQIKACREINLSFSMERNVRLETTLIHNTISKEELHYCIWQKVVKDTVTVGVRVIERGEYALQISAEQNDSTEERKNICNYLLTAEMEKKQRTWENAMEKKTRANMNKLAKNQDHLNDLQNAIETFQDLDLEDKGDLTTAIATLEIGRAEKAINDAKLRRRVDVLETAILQAKSSRFQPTLQTAISRAEKMRDYLKECPDIQDLNIDAMAELRNYNKPLRVIHDVMIAMYLLLGENREQLQNWERIKQLMGRPEELLRKLKIFDPTRVSVQIYEDAICILKPHTKDSASTASPVVGTFYAWAYQTSEKMVQTCSSSD